MTGERVHGVERITEKLPDGITERYRMIVGEPQRKQEITAFAPAPAPHEEYPKDFPFVPHVASYVTICPDGELPPGARWPSDTPDAIAEFLIAQSRADGWFDAPLNDPRVSAINSMYNTRVEMKSTCLMKNNIVRVIVVAHIGKDAMVQLLDTPPAA